MRHQFFGQHVFARFHRFDRDRCVVAERDGDYDRLDVGIRQQFAVIFVDIDALSLLGSQLFDQTDTMFIPVSLDRPSAVRGTQIGDRDDVHVRGRVLRDQDAAFMGRFVIIILDLKLVGLTAHLDATHFVYTYDSQIVSI